MSRLRSERRREQRARDDALRMGRAVFAGWAETEDEVAACADGVRDSLLQSSVVDEDAEIEWFTATGDDAEWAIAQLKRDLTDPRTVDHYEAVTDLLRDRGGLVVVGMARLSPGAFDGGES